MRKVAASIAACAAAFGVFVGAAQAHHSGPEDVAKGRGEITDELARGILSFGGTPPFPNCTDPGAIAGASPGELCFQNITTQKVSFDFDAVLSSQETSTPLGEPHGHMKLSFEFTETSQIFEDGAPIGPVITVSSQSYSATADVTCLTVLNNKATLSGRVTRFEGNVPLQRGLFFDVTDNTIARQQVAPDQFAGTLQPEALQVCPAPTSGTPITRGDILVEDN
jgi:hypothetical protein